MNRHLLQIVLKHADGLTADADADALLLRRYVSTRDDAAFALLVRRHGPMVWAVCRQSVPNHADAEDAFQATFLALAQSAKKVRSPERLAGWLHAAAVRICGKAKRSFTRRTTRERATARTQSDNPVSAAAWADLQAAVHAAVSGLPPSLRAVFVLCDLEGAEPAAAAKQLGLKAGTLSGQLARARQRVLAALTKRGLAAGAVALGSAVTVPEALAHKVTGGTVPSAAVIELASEVTTMGVSKLKLLAAGLLLAGGLTLTGLGLISKADGQPPSSGGYPGGPPAPGGLSGGGPPGGGVPGPGGSLPGLPGPGGPGIGGPGLPPGPGGGGDGGGIGVGLGRGSGGGAAPAAGDYLFVGKPNTVGDVAKLLKDKATKGWEYTGPLDVDPADPPKGAEFEAISKDTRVVLVFKKKPTPGGGGFMTGGPGGGLGGPGGGLGGMGLTPGLPAPGVGGGVTAPAPKQPGTGIGNTPGPGAKLPGGVMGTGPGPGSTPAPGRPGGDTGPLNPLGDGGEAERFEVIKLKNALAEDVVKVLHDVFNGPNKGPGRIRLVADSRTNSLIVVKASAADLEVIQKLLAKTIDVEGKPAK